METLQNQFIQLSREMADVSSDVKSIFNLLNAALATNGSIPPLENLSSRSNAQPTNQKPPSSSDDSQPIEEDGTRSKTSESGQSSTIVGILKSRSGLCRSATPSHRVEFVSSTSPRPVSDPCTFRSSSSGLADPVLSGSPSSEDYATDNLTAPLPVLPSSSTKSRTLATNLRKVGNISPDVVQLQLISKNLSRVRDFDEISTESGVRKDSGIDIGKEGLEMGSHSTLLSTDL